MESTRFHHPAFILLIAFLLGIVNIQLKAEAGNNRHNIQLNSQLMRFPDIHENLVVFVSGEDLWTVPATGGTARRLTLHDGEERYPKFSPDGQSIAFTGEYDGNADVYVMNTHGGNITRLTFHPSDDEVTGWHPTKNKIIFRSRRASTNSYDRLFMVSPDGSGIETLILPEGGHADFSPDGKQIAYNQIARDHRAWKRYVGGLAEDIYLYHFDSQINEKLTSFKGTDRFPMWRGDKIYFSSDRDGILNIHSYDLNSRKIQQVTFHKNIDIRRPSIGKDKIVYELGGNLWCLNLLTGKSAKIPVTRWPDAPETRPYMKTVSGFVTGYTCSPTGNRILLTARGDVFSVPKKNGPIRNLTNDSGSREKDAAWSPDGNSVAFISDKSGEYEIYTIDSRGNSRAVKLTAHKDGYRHTLRWSPDGKKIAFADHTLSCYLLDIQSGNITKVDKAEYEHVDVPIDLKPIHDYRWSPDSRFLAYSKMDASLVRKIYIYSLETGKNHCVSNGLFNDFGPVFSTDGRHLFFISSRLFNPTFCDFEWEMVYKKISGIFCLTLRKNGPPLLPHLCDEEESQTAQPKRDTSHKNTKILLTIDFDGIAERIEMLPLPAGNYRNLSVSNTAIFYMNAEDGDFNPFEFREIETMDLYAFDFEKRNERSILKELEGYHLSANGSHIVYKKSNSVGLIDSSAKSVKHNPLDLSDLRMTIHPQKEWLQIFNEVWRMERDFYYEPNMNGADWPAMKKKYQPLIMNATCRQDVRYIMAELIGELSTSHTYISGGDRQRHAKGIDVGLLGADYEEDTANKRYRFKKIYRVPDWSRHIKPPLYGPGIHVNEGDYLLEVNGRKVTSDKNIFSYFQDLAGKQITIKVNSTPSEKGAERFTVIPVAGERKLRYQDWVESNRRKVEKESGGQIGYIHFPDTFTSTGREFPKYFYSQTHKKGLILDGRFNGGGLSPDIFLSRLDKQIRSYWTRRHSHDYLSPTYATRAHFALITNKHAGSGGDELPHIFRQRRMGPIFGTRTWGGLVGISMTYDLVDDGTITTPDYRIYTPQGRWVVENEGVEPDFAVELHPAEMEKGFDAQLMKTLRYLMKKIKEEPRTWPKHGPFPVDKLRKSTNE